MNAFAKFAANRRAHTGTPMHRGSHQRGAALIMSLMILLILTILGITAMGTSSLQEKMAGNIQEGTKGFEVGESGLMSTLNDATNFVPNNATPATKVYPSSGTLNGRVARVTTTYLETTEVPRSIGGYDTTFNAFHFQQSSEVKGSLDAANIGLNTTITRGVTQISKKQN